MLIKIFCHRVMLLHLINDLWHSWDSVDGKRCQTPESISFLLVEQTFEEMTRPGF